MYLYDKNMVVTTNHKYAELPWEWEWERFFSCGDPHRNSHRIPMGIPTVFLWEWDGNGNGNSIPTATVVLS